jgi:NADH:ubiquinone oxidoreductase subunit 5 (subunit L)/multisubunit Na+/H+ antiporter MnhA subunit
MYLLLVFLPLIGSVSAGLFGRKLGPFGASLVTAFFISLFAFYEVSLVGCCVYIKLAPWINSELLNVDWGFLFDSLTVVMCCVVTFVSSTVHLYFTEYMAHDPHLPGFISYLSLLTFFMLILVVFGAIVLFFSSKLYMKLLLLLLIEYFSQLECWIQLRDVFLYDCLVFFIMVKRI